MKQKNYLHITTEHRGKMKRLISVNTDSRNNTYCIIAHQCAGTVCEHCYFWKYHAGRMKPCNAWTRNGEMLQKPLQAIPLFWKDTLVRFHAFGELHNATHFINFCRIAEANPARKFALWTKRADIIRRYYPRAPRNLVLIYSSPIINVPSARPIGFHKVFTVYTRQYIKDQKIKINCAQSCNECRTCYSRRGATVIKEILK
jgi:hypothetical protein